MQKLQIECEENLIISTKGFFESIKSMSNLNELNLNLNNNNIIELPICKAEKLKKLIININNNYINLTP